MKLNLNFPQNKPFDAVGLGLTAIDHVITIPYFPAQNTKMPLTDYQIHGGGQIGTGLTALSRLGLKVKFLGKVGGDPMGELSLKLLKDEGINVDDAVTEKEASTQFAFILVDQSTGMRNIFWHRHPLLSFREEDFSKEAITSGRILQIDGHEVAASIRGARFAKEEGIPVLLDAERLKDGTTELMKLADIIIADENMASLLCPGKTSREFLHHIDKTYRPVFCAVTLGEKGSLGLFRDTFIPIPAYKVNVTDTTGAGDVYHAAFLYGALQNWEIPQIMRFSGAAAALKCLHPGGRKGAPTLAQIKDLMQDQFPGASS